MRRFSALMLLTLCAAALALAQAPPSYTITNAVGNGTAGFAGDSGKASEAQINYPLGLAVDNSGNIFIADHINHRIRRVAADGTITENELAFARKLARKWGYAPDRLEGLLDMAKNNQLVLRVPEKPKDREKVYRLMCKAAAADEAIAPQEQALLDFYRQQAKLTA